MAYVDVKHKKIVDVPDKPMGTVKCTSLCAMCIVSDDLYCIKTDTESSNDKHAAYLVRIKSFTESSRTLTYSAIDHNGTRKMFHHANGLTYHKKSGDATGTFYIATGNDNSDDDDTNDGSQIIGIDKSGKVTMRIEASGAIWAISYYGNEKYIIGPYIKDSGVREYKIVTFEKKSGDKYKAVKDSSFFIKTDPAYDKGNDIYYDRASKMLYVPMFKDKGKNNIILSYSLSGGAASTEQNPLISERTLRDHNTAKFEIEGVDIYNSKKYVCVNRDNSEKDGIYQLYT